MRIPRNPAPVPAGGSNRPRIVSHHLWGTKGEVSSPPHPHLKEVDAALFPVARGRREFWGSNGVGMGMCCAQTVPYTPRYNVPRGVSPILGGFHAFGGAGDSRLDPFENPGTRYGLVVTTCAN